jgi:hypothetical protein
MARLVRRSKKKHRVHADAFAAIGELAFGKPIDHRTRFGLILNADRIAYRRAFPFLLAVRGGIGAGVAAQFHEALAASEAAARDSMGEEEHKRALAEALARGID